MALREWDEVDENYQPRYVRHLFELGRYFRQKHHYELCHPESSPPPCIPGQRAPLRPTEDRLSIHGFGQLVPLPAMPNESVDEHWTRNRRVEFTIVRRQ